MVSSEKTTAHLVTTYEIGRAYALVRLHLLNARHAFADGRCFEALEALDYALQARHIARILRRWPYPKQTR